MKITGLFSADLVKALPRLSNAIGRQLFNREDTDETFIVTFSKKCRTCDEVLFDLKRIANITKDVRPEELFGIPLITEEEAKKLLNEEVQQVVESYKLIGGNIFNGYFGANSHILRGNLLKRLATELFGGDIVENLENMNPSEYILFLNRLGYRTKSLEVSDYPYSDYPYPDYLIKQQHLLSFFCQSYEKTQYHLIQKFRKMYQNRPPKMVITGETEDIDFSNFKKMSLPDQASVSALLFHEPYNTGSDALSVVNAEHDTTYLYSRMSHVPNNTNFRELQTIACREVGIKFL